MKPTTTTALLAACTTATSATSLHPNNLPPNPQSPYLFSNPPRADAASGTSYRIPTSYESAVLGRRILALTKLGTLATVFPTHSKSKSESKSQSNPHHDFEHDVPSSSGEPVVVGATENRPPGLGGMPLGLPEYLATCEEDTSDNRGNPTLLAITIATSFKNAAAGSNVSLAVQWTPVYPPAKRMRSVETEPSSGWRGSWVGGIMRWFGFGMAGGEVEEGQQTVLVPDEEDQDHDPMPYSAANLPRFSLIGYIEPIDGSDDHSTPGSVGSKLAACFVAKHPDSRYWLPGSRVHESHFVRLVVQGVYWVGGFGDRAYIGWIPVEEWTAVTRDEWEAVRLPGEKEGWKEWAVGLEGEGEL